MVIDKNARVILEFGLTWKSLYALHRDKYLACPVTIGTDLFPEQFLDSLVGILPGHWQRPEDDPHYPGVMKSDPVYVVWGRRRA